jgi:hypothetical protein
MNRRRFLGGIGAALALPLLESLSPATARAQSSPNKRLVIVFFPNGTDSHNEWRLGGSGTSYTFGTAHQSLAPYRDQLTLIRRINNTHVTGSPAHSRGSASFLTGVNITQQNVARAGPSIDQVIAAQIGGATALRSLQLGPTPYPAGAEPSDTGWSPTYNLAISWSSPSVFNLAIEDPQIAHDRLFGVVDPNAAAAAKRARYRQSILDSARNEAATLRRQVSRGDRSKLDQLETAIREVEQRLGATMTPTPSCGGSAPGNGTRSFAEHTSLMIDLLVLALACDRTRVVTYQMDYAFGNKDFAFLVGGTRQLHHNITHTGSSADPNATQKHQAITTWYVERFAELVGKLEAVGEGAGTLLDASLVLLGSELGDGRGHNGADLPLILAGGGAGTLAPGRLIDAGGVPHEQLLLALAHKMDVPLADFAGVTTPLAGL